MRATPPPIALLIAAAATSVLAAVLAPLVVPSAALAERWLRPVPGEVARPFDYARGAPFTPGAHRGVDLAAPPGTAVRAACGGTVVHAGRVAGRGVVSVRCGGRRVSHLPLRAIVVRAGTRLRAGAPIGTLAAGHGGLHLGVRDAADPFGYRDPTALLPGREHPLAPIAARPRRIGRPRRIRVPPRAAPLRVRAPARMPRAIAPWRPAAVAPDDGAPAWPVWLGAALVLCGRGGVGHGRGPAPALSAPSGVRCERQPRIEGSAGRRRRVDVAFASHSDAKATLAAVRRRAGARRQSAPARAHPSLPAVRDTRRS